MNNIIDYFVPPQDPILGIESATLVNRLDASNWHRGAIVRRHENSRHYIYLSRASCARPRKHYYCVNVYDLDRCQTLSRLLFDNAIDALDFANDNATRSRSSNRKAA